MAFIQQIPYYIATIIVLIVVFVALVESQGIFPVVVLFSVWIFALTSITCERAAKDIET